MKESSVEKQKQHTESQGKKHILYFNVVIKPNNF